MLKWTSSIAALLLVVGCATANGPLGGTTKLKSSYESHVKADGTEDTSVSIDAAGKAADVLQAVTKASLETADGTGSTRRMAFGATQNNDATQRGIDYVQAHQADVEMYKAIIPALTQAIADSLSQAMQLGAPLIGQHMQNQAAQDQLNAQNRAALQQSITGIIGPMLQQQQAAQQQRFQNMIDAAIAGLRSSLPTLAIPPATSPEPLPPPTTGEPPVAPPLELTP